VAIISKQSLKVQKKEDIGRKRKTKITSIGLSTNTRYRNKNDKKNRKKYNCQG